MKTFSLEEEFISKMLDVKHAADNKEPLFSCQGQAMDGYSELANYRGIIDDYEKGKV
jgi:hypothetical protein